MRRIQRDIVGAFIFSADDKILLGKAGVYQGEWCVPGGGVNEGETKLEAVKREIGEETGIDINQGKVEEIEGTLMGESEKVLRDTQEKVFVEMTFFNYKVTLPLRADEITLSKEDDFKDAQWFPVSDLFNLKLSPPSIITLKKLGYL